MKIIKTFNDIIGNEQIKATLIDSIITAKSENRALDNILIYGPSGFGKSTLANVISNEMGVRCEEVNCSVLSSNLQMFVNLIMKLPDKSILFLDEIQSLPMSFIEGVLYRYMDEGKLFMQYPDKLIPIKLDKTITLIGATTEIDQIPTPLYNRFNSTLKLSNYNFNDLKTITYNNIISENFTIDDESLIMLANASRGVPREIQQVIRIVKNYCKARDIDHITDDITKVALERSGINSSGLDKIDQLYISTLFYTFNNSPTGIESLCSVMNESKKMLIMKYEPFLLKRNLLTKTSRGRMLTPEGIQVALELGEVES